ncbi:MAG: NADH:ubiquinone oxidoreductase [Prevotellaceae bacterium]|jgi:Ni,Fe-hydrogenase III small subunit|nr:NADH:ubiquinone oxidoreductase [Prevotellaceae bacterium]
MNLLELKISSAHGVQYVKNLEKATLTPLFRGRPEIDTNISIQELQRAETICPSKAINAKMGILNLGKCVFCKECEFVTQGKIRFTNDYKIATNDPDCLLIRKEISSNIRLNENAIRKEIRSYFGRALKLRQVSSGGDNSNELELYAAGNVNFDMGRFGIEFVASPRHADGLVITGPLTKNMAGALNICYEAMPSPKLLILAGTDAISGGMFADSEAIDRSFLTKYKADLYVPGNPVHPLTFINGLLYLLGRNAME